MKGRLICYLCDPDKNTGCTKEYCAYNPNAIQRECFRTLEKEYARLDFAGQPCENPDINGTNTHRVKENFEEDGPMVVQAEYLDANTMRISKEIARETKEAGLPWFAGLFNPKIFQNTTMGQKKTEETEETT